MDSAEGLARLPHLLSPKPLHLRKSSSQALTTQRQTQLSFRDSNSNNNTTDTDLLALMLHPSRPSSAHIPVASGNYSWAHEPFPSLEDTPIIPEHDNHHHFQHPSSSNTSIASPRSIVSAIEAPYLFNSSAAIMGNFVPISHPEIKTVQPPKKGLLVPEPAAMQTQSVANSRMATSNMTSQLSNVTRRINPYEFEPGTPIDKVNHRMRMADFSNKHDSSPAALPSPLLTHVKNSQSEGHPGPVTQQSKSPFRPENLTRNVLYRNRSESSPHIPSLPFQDNHVPSVDSSFRSYAGVDDDLDGVAINDILTLDSARQHSHQDTQQCSSRFDSYQDHQSYNAETPSRSPSRLPDHSFNADRSASVAGRYHRSPTKVLDDVFERDESGAGERSPKPPLSPPQKRSRSPMKKMFGENGWLGRSPNELEDLKLRAKKASSSPPKNESRRSPSKKTSMMGKLRNKFEEFAEKADMVPKYPRSSNDRHPKLTMLTISLSPPEQAKLDMELELSLVHTASTFLMNQFRQGRMDVESIKKATDVWKSKGRPRVTDFMYDQATQRELVVANQHNFRFHGERAGDDIRINSMLYNWKQVANVMAVRTFCNADTVILKLVFDIEQILELLGATEPILLRLQQLRTRANESMHIARRKENGNPPGGHGHYEEMKEPAYDTRSSASGRSMASDKPTGPKYRGSREKSLGHRSDKSLGNRSSATTRSIVIDKTFDDPYGGMKLVPDHYKQEDDC